MTEREQRPIGATAYGTPAAGTAPAYSAAPVARRGPESLGGLLLILAGIAAAVSLLLDWLGVIDASGWGLATEGFDDLGSIVSHRLWEPLGIVLGGGVLSLLCFSIWLSMGL